MRSIIYPEMSKYFKGYFTASHAQSPVKRIFIVDEGPEARDKLSRLITLKCPRLSVVGEASGMAEFSLKIKALRPDFVLLDVRLTDGIVLSILQALDLNSFKILFVTEADKNMVQALKLSNLDYLEKPVNPEKINAAILKVESNNQLDITLQLQALEANILLIKNNEWQH